VAGVVVSQAGLARSAEDIAASLDRGEWDVTVADGAGRSVEMDGEPVTVRDTVLRAVRRR